MKIFRSFLIAFLAVALFVGAVIGTLTMIFIYGNRNDYRVDDLLFSHDTFVCDDLNLIVYWNPTKEKEEFIKAHNLDKDEVMAPGRMFVNGKEYIIDFVPNVEYNFLIEDLSVDDGDKVLISGTLGVDKFTYGENVYLRDLITDLTLPNESKKLKIVGK